MPQLPGRPQGSVERTTYMLRFSWKPRDIEYFNEEMLLGMKLVDIINNEPSALFKTRKANRLVIIEVY